jgi:mRNA interferase RelE/StbE
LVWTIEISNAAERALKKLDRQTVRRIGNFIDSRLNGTDNPRQIGKPLHGSLENYWSYRVGDYRILCDLQDNKLIVLVVEIGHRSDVYR